MRGPPEKKMVHRRTVASALRPRRLNSSRVTEATLLQALFLVEMSEHKVISNNIRKDPSHTYMLSAAMVYRVAILRGNTLPDSGVSLQNKGLLNRESTEYRRNTNYCNFKIPCTYMVIFWFSLLAVRLLIGSYACDILVWLYFFIFWAFFRTYLQNLISWIHIVRESSSLLSLLLAVVVSY